MVEWMAESGLGAASRREVAELPGAETGPQQTRGVSCPPVSIMSGELRSSIISSSSACCFSSAAAASWWRPDWGAARLTWGKKGTVENVSMV